MNRFAYDPERVIARIAEQLAAAHARIAKLEVVVEQQQVYAAQQEPTGTVPEDAP